MADGSGSSRDLPGALELSDVKVGTRVLAKDYESNWYLARIVQVDGSNPSRCKVHFDDWDSDFDEVRLWQRVARPSDWDFVLSLGH